MSKEALHHPSSPEKFNLESKEVFEGARNNKLEKTSSKEKEVEELSKQEKNIEKARGTINKEALSGKEYGSRHSETSKDKSPKFVGKEIKRDTFKKVMDRTQSQLPKNQRVFSKFVHAPAVEKSSEIIGKTIARPSALFTGGLISLIGMLVVLLTAKRTGFVLSGSEMMILFAVGWAIGIAVDLIYHSISKIKPSKH